MALQLFFLASLLLLCPAALGSVHKYLNQEFYLPAPSSDALIFRGGREGMRASTQDAVLHWTTLAKGVANGKSYIRFDGLRFYRPSSSANAHQPFDGQTGLVQALIFEVNDLNRIGHSADGGRSFCCTRELAQKLSCTLGHVIVKPQSGDNQWPRVVDINFMFNDTEVTAARSEIKITKTGMYYLWFVICDTTLSGVTVSGSTVWKNPSGYLPGMMAPFLGFFGWMTIAYFALGAIWFILCLRFWKDILQLQNCITIVIFLGMGEMSMWYFDFVNFNATGLRPIGITVWAVILGVIRKTLSRLLILVVSMGYGVVRPTLGGLSNKVMALGGAYMLASGALDVMQNVGAIDDLNSSERIILVMPVAILDAVFILWIFTSLSKTLSILQSKRVSHKMELYRKFTNLLAISVLTSIGWIIYEMYFKVTDQFNERWQSDWIISAFWHVLTFVLLCGICILWSPSQSSTRYAFSEDQADDFDEETVALTSGAVAAKGNSEEKPAKKPVNTDVFSLDDDVEEGKLE